MEDGEGWRVKCKANFILKIRNLQFEIRNSIAEGWETAVSKVKTIEL